MSYHNNYIGYKQTAKVGTTFIPIVTGEPISSAAATILATTIASFKDWFPAKHSNWWHWDTAFENKDWAKLIAMSAKFYSIDGLNYVDWERNQLSDHIPLQYKGYTRLQLLPIVYNNTNDPFILKLINEAIQKGKLPQSVSNSSVDNITSSATNVLTNVTKSTSSLLLYAGIGLGLFLLLKKKK
jgi:hypothetical protein